MLINLLNFDREGLRAYFVSINEKPFRGDQVFQWIHQYGYQDFSKMTNVNQSLREYLHANTIIKLPAIAHEQLSQDGTRKWLLQLEDEHHIEMVFIPEDDRGTLCISSQAGCALNCQFCATGQQGFKRNLTVAEIIGQVWLAVRLLSEQNGRHDRHITNIVFMGMGEPLLNFDNVVSAINMMEDDLGYGLSKYRVTVSTAGIVPMMDKLSRVSDVSLAISLHAPNDELRNQLMPINKKYPLAEVIAAAKRFFQDQPKRKVSIEYILLRDVNDTIAHAKQLIKLLEGLPCKVNLIPFNTCPGLPYKTSTDEAIEHFRNKLMASGLNTVTRKTRGADIQAACGQLSGEKIIG